MEFYATDAEIFAVCICKDDKLEDDNIDWIDCNKCSIWVHKNCVTANEQDDDVCAYCM